MRVLILGGSRMLGQKLSQASAGDLACDFRQNPWAREYSSADNLMSPNEVVELLGHSGESG